MKKRILIVFGTRPEAIKIAPVIKLFENYRQEFQTKVCVTAQHRQMLDEVLRLFKIKPDYDLNIMQDEQSLYQITTATLSRIKKILDIVKPDLVLVHGDTTTTFAATLAVFYQGIAVGHVEAGLRSYNRQQPFPEEANRLLTDALCDLYFAPTLTAKNALLKENIPERKIFVTGNTVIDALYSVLAQKKGFTSPALKDIFGSSGKYDAERVILVTAHRRENFGKPLENIFRALRRIAQKYKDIRIIYPVHLNPNVWKPANRILNGLDNIILLSPVNYSDLTNLMKLSYLVVTDSGGLQEEAPALGKPVLVLREVTERPEAVKAGTVKVIGINEENVFTEICGLLDNRKLYNNMARAINPYGDGKAAIRTVEAIRYYFGFRPGRSADFRAVTK